MAIIALLPGDTKSREIYLGNKELPQNYMGDFTLMGFVVDSYQEALTLLTSAGYQLDELESEGNLTTIGELGFASKQTSQPTAIKNIIT